jgi:ATP-binding cassette subfamily F protein 2
VLDADQELIDLEKEAEELTNYDDMESQELLNDIYERMDELNSDMRETKAARILHGLGFTKEMYTHFFSLFRQIESHNSQPKTLN